MLLVILSIVGVIGIAGVGILNQPQFGKNPSGERLERIEKSPHYKEGHFQNETPTTMMTTDKGMLSIWWDFLFKNYPNTVPDSGQIQIIKTDLSKLDKNQDLILWFGHSSYLIQAAGKRYLVDPVFYAGAPFQFINKAFPGTQVYTPEDIPDIDFLIISHDHFDHLDYKTVTQIKDRVGHVVTGLGVGSHLEYWGYSANKLTELDWNESASFADGIQIHCLPARHFSGRSLFQTKTLWASFVLETPSGKIYIGGDSGYGTHFARIGTQFPNLDLAILENGQYDENWANIHTLPRELPLIAKDLNAKRYMTVHNSKFKLANHSWDEPLKNAEALRSQGFDVLMPTIGEAVEWKKAIVSPEQKTVEPVEN